VTSTRPAWTLTEAVERTGASRSTIRRYREAGKFPNAYKDTAGTWRFPLEDLLAVGLSPSEPARERAQSKPSEQSLNMSTEHASTSSAEQMSKLEQALILERTRAENAERLAASYLANVEDLRRALRMLEAGTGKPEQATEPAQSTVTEHAQPAPADHPQPRVSTPEQHTKWSALRRLLNR
jgi:predicted DNA-binding transcriptional regulator AlpA